jgi:hypothetical protein
MYKPSVTAFAEQIQEVPLQDMALLDERPATPQFTHERGRALCGLRLVDRVPQGRCKLLTILAAMNVEWVVKAASIEATADGDVLRTFIIEALAPNPQPGQVVVKDNLPHPQGRGRAGGDRRVGLPIDLPATVLSKLLAD